VNVTDRNKNMEKYFEKYFMITGLVTDKSVLINHLIDFSKPINLAPNTTPTCLKKDCLF